MSIAIPRIMGHIWVGHRPPPIEWMQTWRDRHPDWEYRLYDNEYLFSRRWRRQAFINAFFARGMYSGVSDLMRYEILHETGGFIPEADSICLRPTDELWDRPALYTVYENEVRKPGLVSPFLASVPGHPFLDTVMRLVRRRNDPARLRSAWRTVGSGLLRRAIRDRNPEDLVIFPSHYFIPQHKKLGRYQGDGPVYCEQLWASSLDLYTEPGPQTDVEALRAEHLARLDARSKPSERVAASAGQQAA